MYGGNSSDPREIYGFKMIANAFASRHLWHQRPVFQLWQRHHQRVFSRWGVRTELSCRRFRSRLPSGTSSRIIFRISSWISPPAITRCGRQYPQRRGAGRQRRRRRLSGADAEPRGCAGRPPAADRLTASDRPGRGLHRSVHFSQLHLDRGVGPGYCCDCVAHLVAVPPRRRSTRAAGRCSSPGPPAPT